jgi:hypothetical protein
MSLNVMDLPPVVRRALGSVPNPDALADISRAPSETDQSKIRRWPPSLVGALVLAELAEGGQLPEAPSSFVNAARQFRQFARAAGRAERNAAPRQARRFLRRAEALLAEAEAVWPSQGT